MRKLAKPIIKVIDVIDDCIDNMTDIALKSEIQKKKEFSQQQNQTMKVKSPVMSCIKYP